MQHANPLRMATDLGMLLAFTLTALFGLASASIPVLAGEDAFPQAGSRPATAAAVVEPDTATAAIELEVLRPTVKEATSAAQAVLADVLDRARRPERRRIGHPRQPASASSPEASARAACPTEMKCATTPATPSSSPSATWTASTPCWMRRPRRRRRQHLQRRFQPLPDPVPLPLASETRAGGG